MGHKFLLEKWVVGIPNGSEEAAKAPVWTETPNDSEGGRRMRRRLKATHGHEMRFILTSEEWKKRESPMLVVHVR